MKIKKGVRPIPGHHGYYTDKCGIIYSGWVKGHSILSDVLRPLSQKMSKAGYSEVCLHNFGRRKSIAVHRLVLLTFKGIPPRGMICCHGPRGRGDNSLSNLAYGTPSKNGGIDRVRDGTINWGERNGQAKLNALQVRIIRRLREDGMYQKYVAEIFNVSETTIWKITRRVKWRHLP